MTATVLLPMLPRPRRARRGKLLTAVYERFTEGFDTTDLVSAKALLKPCEHLERSDSLGEVWVDERG